MKFRDDDEEGGSAPARPSGGAAQLRALRALYAQVDRLLEGFRCAASGECCQLTKTGRLPQLFPVELRLLEAAVAGRWPAPRGDGGCPFLETAGVRCSVYAARPFGCRTFFCERVRPAGPGLPRKLPTEAIFALTARLTALSDQSEPDADPRPILDLVDAARRGGERR